MNTRLLKTVVVMLLMLLPVSVVAQWSYYASGNVLSAYGEGNYTAQNPLSITLNAPADLQFNGTYKPATISNTAAWEAAGLTVPTILYNGKTNAPSMLGTYTATISAGGATAEVVYTIKTVIDFQSFFNNGITQGHNFDVIASTGAYEVGLNNTEQKGVWWDPVENCAVFDGEAYLQIDNPLGNVNANTGFTLTMDVWISSNNNSSGKFYRSTGEEVNKNGWQRLFDLSDGNVDHCIFINAGNANSGTAHLMWCLRKDQQSGKLEVWNNTNKSYYDQWCTITMVVAPGGYTTLYVNGVMLTHSSSSDIPKITNVLSSIADFDQCFIGTSIFEASGNNADGFFYGKIRGFQTAEGALMPYYDGSQYHYLLSYETNGGNPITGTFEATIPTTLPTPTHSNPAAVFQGWYIDEALTVPVTTGVTLTQNTSLYAKWNYTVKMADGTEDVARWSVYPTSAPEGATITVNYIGSRNVESIEIGNTHTYYVNSTSELATQLANFNANPGSRLVLNTNVSTMTITAEEGVIDLNGHTVTSNSSFLLQNNTLGKAITIKNGTIIGMDGAIGWGDVYKGTVILENIYVVNDLYTDGHAYILRNGTYKNVQNFTKGDAPGTVTVYSGVTIRNRNSVGASGGTYAGTFIDLTVPAPNISGVTEVVHNAQWTFAMPAHNADVFVTYADFEGSGTESDPYLIPDLATWNTLAGKVNTGMTYDDKFFLQTGDISGATAFMGIFVDNQLYNQKPFMGIYDGGGHTLNVTLNASVGFLAPIRCVYDAIIKNLVVTGSVTASSRHASGLVGALAGPCTVENCLVSTNVSGTDYMGGVIGHCRLDNFTIVGCVFNGTLTASGDGYTGGFNGWGGEPQTTNATITNCFFAGTYVNSSGGKFHPVGCFGGANATRTISNVYYTQPLVGMTNETNVSIVKSPVTYKGEFAYSITAGEGVTVAAAGTSTASYDVSKLNFYGENGFALNGALYGGQGDVVSMNLTHADAPVDYSFSHYSTDNGTLAGTDNPYSITMASANSVINANYIIDEYRIDSIRTTWTVEFGGTSHNVIAYSANDTMGYVMIPVNSEFVIIPSNDQRSLVSKLELIDKTPPTGAINGLFSVSATKQVFFSQGNLQATYDGTDWSWAFATNQWDYIGDGGSATVGNEMVTESSPFISGNGTVDLFGWVGASSTWEGAAQYGISNSIAINKTNGYGTGASEALKSDWGNTIGSGWRTLTSAEWNYIFNTRTSGSIVNGTTNACYTFATINTDGTGVNGMILFPDGITVANSEATSWGTINGGSDWGTKCTSVQWTALAAKGCVFLPAAGYRQKGAYDHDSEGYYWSSSPDTSSVHEAYRVFFNFAGTLYPASNNMRFYGHSVRLVRDAN